MATLLEIDLNIFAFRTNIDNGVINFIFKFLLYIYFLICFRLQCSQDRMSSML